MSALKVGNPYWTWRSKDGVLAAQFSGDFVSEKTDDLFEKESKIVETLIEKKILEAKLVVTESRLNHVLVLAGVFLTVFGILLPLWIANSSSDKSEKAVAAMEDKTDRAIDKMEARFRELSGTALRKPELDCFIDGKKLDGAVLQFSPNKRQRIVEVRNLGDAPARNIYIRIYSNLQTAFARFVPDARYEIYTLRENDEEGLFKYAHSVEEGVGSLDTKDSIRFTLRVDGDLQSTNVVGLIKILYEQPEPKRVSFNIVVSDKD